MSFIERLKNRGVETNKVSFKPTSVDSPDSAVNQLDVDVFQTEKKIVVYAQVAGVDKDQLKLSIEGEANIILIEGEKIRPENLIVSDKGSYFARECNWGKFYRRIILPESIDISLAEAKIKEGVLILALPFVTTAKKKKLKAKIKSNSQ